VPVGDPETATFQWGLRSVVNGGLRYTPGDSEASKDAGFYVPNQALTFSESIGTYFRIDARVAFRKNLEKTAYMISLDVQNATGRSNVRDQIFEPGSGELKNRFQAGLIPVFSFQLDF
ncbi:MAG: TonB-dependent receptor, partial [Bacteroidota bacterium]